MCESGPKNVLLSKLTIIKISEKKKFILKAKRHKMLKIFV